MSTDLPRWVWDILADLIDHEDQHGTGEQDWHCLDTILNRTPAEVLSAARVIAHYRGQTTTAEPPEPSPVCPAFYEAVDGCSGQLGGVHRCVTTLLGPEHGAPIYPHRCVCTFTWTDE